MNADELRQTLQPWLDKQQRPAWKPVVTEEDGPATASKFGGTPWLAQDEAWPQCPECNAQLPFFMQLNLAELPAAAQKVGTGLLQLFYCTECSSWEPFAASHLVRIVQPSGEPQTELPQAVIDTFPAKLIVEWQEFTDYPNPQEREELGLLVSYNWDDKPHITRIEAAEFGIDINGTLDSKLVEELPSAEQGDKLGGWPFWVQGIEYPECPQCQTRMELIFQLDSEDNLPYMFGDVGTGHITQCPNHPEIVAFGWACY